MLIKNTIYQSMDYKKTAFPADRVVRKELPCSSLQVAWGCLTDPAELLWMLKFEDLLAEPPLLIQCGSLAPGQTRQNTSDVK